MLRFIVDTQLPPVLARWLKDKGFDAIHTTHFQDGHLMSDARIVSVAIAEHRIIVTKDSDFLENFLLNGTPPQVLLLKLGNCTNQDLLAHFERHFHQIQELFNQGAGLVQCSSDHIAEYIN